MFFMYLCMDGSISSVAAGQMVTRLQLTWYGTPASNVAQAALAFQIVIMILVGYICLRVFVFMTLAYLDPNAEPGLKYYRDPPPAYFFFAALDDLLFYIYFAFVVILLRNIRSHLRLRYAIPESEGRCTEGCEDVCCSLFCPCFTVAQMLRHTADYETYTAACCTSTGLRKTAPGIV
jgi:Cys-rich protein (TIGR01571 family)